MVSHLFLKPGTLYFSGAPVDVVTVLGSCVSVCIYDSHLKRGGICHYYLPIRTSDGATSDRYGDFAIPNLLRKFKQGGSKKEDLIAKVLGGGAVLQDYEDNLGNVGRENVRLAKRVLSKYKIAVSGVATGGFHGKKVRFNTYTGEVQYREVTSHRKELPPARGEKIKVMILDDSKTIRRVLRSMIERDSAFTVIWEAEHPYEAQKLMRKERPDVITLDINMPYMDGVTFLDLYMRQDPIPTVMVTSINYNDSGPVFKALELGATDYIKKPELSEIESRSTELHIKLKNAFLMRDEISRREPISSAPAAPILSERKKEKYIISVGASTGGTRAIKELLLKLPPNIPPILIVIHIPPIFSKAYADRLNSCCPFDVKEAEDGDEIRGGGVWIAPGGRHMRLKERNGRLKISLGDDPPKNSFRPSVDLLFDSLEKIKEKRVIGALLTGMGEDGARGLLKLKRGGSFTLAQSEASSVVFGMPKAAIELGAATRVANLQEISRLMVEHMERTTIRGGSSSR